MMSLNNNVNNTWIKEDMNELFSGVGEKSKDEILKDLKYYSLFENYNLIGENLDKCSTVVYNGGNTFLKVFFEGVYIKIYKWRIELDDMQTKLNLKSFLKLQHPYPKKDSKYLPLIAELTGKLPMYSFDNDLFKSKKITLSCNVPGILCTDAEFKEKLDEILFERYNLHFSDII